MFLYLSAKLGFGTAEVTSTFSSIDCVLDTGLLERVLCLPNEGSEILISM